MLTGSRIDECEAATLEAAAKLPVTATELVNAEYRVRCLVNTGRIGEDVAALILKIIRAFPKPLT